MNCRHRSKHEKGDALAKDVVETNHGVGGGYNFFSNSRMGSVTCIYFLRYAYKKFIKGDKDE